MHFHAPRLVALRGGCRTEETPRAENEGEVLMRRACARALSPRSFFVPPPPVGGLGSTLLLLSEQETRPGRSGMPKKNSPAALDLHPPYSLCSTNRPPPLLFIPSSPPSSPLSSFLYPLTLDSGSTFPFPISFSAAAHYYLPFACEQRIVLLSLII